jgi:iron(III) transport system ATP-binding protein
MFLKIDSIQCKYDAEPVVLDFSLSIEHGEQASLLGPSGCGKTTVLRAIAGFQKISHGQISIGSKVISSDGLHIPPEERRVGMVFQDHALFPHMNVEQNISVGMSHIPSKKRAIRANEFLERMGLMPERKKFPHELSGGQAQRVALARALVPSPHLVLMDEPFSSLDSELRERMRIEVAELLRSEGATALMVTHDQNDAFAFGKKLGVMCAGKLEQWASPHDIYYKPQNRFVADFIGSGVFLAGHMKDSRTIVTDHVQLDFLNSENWKAGTKIEVLIRPDDIIYDPGGDQKLEVISKSFQGAQTLYMLLSKNEMPLLALFPSNENFGVGEKVPVRFEVDHVVAYPL